MTCARCCIVVSRGGTLNVYETTNKTANCNQKKKETDIDVHSYTDHNVHVCDRAYITLCDAFLQARQYSAAHSTSPADYTCSRNIWTDCPTPAARLLAASLLLYYSPSPSSPVYSQHQLLISSASHLQQYGPNSRIDHLSEFSQRTSRTIVDVNN
jgi:hypothetical protein